MVLATMTIVISSHSCPKPEAEAASYLVDMKHAHVSIEDSRCAGELCCDMMLSCLGRQFSAAEEFHRSGEGTGGATTTTTTTGSEQPLPFPLAAPRDAEFLSPLQCYVRARCVEYFAVVEQPDVPVPTPKAVGGGGGHRRRGPRSHTSIGRVGIRCIFCGNDPEDDDDTSYSRRENQNQIQSSSQGRPRKAAQSSSFPGGVSGIYGAVVMMQCRHFPYCPDVPAEVKKRMAALKAMGNSPAIAIAAATTVESSSDTRSHSFPSSSVSSTLIASSSSAVLFPLPPGFGRRRYYWTESAEAMGFTDDADGDGIRFSADETSSLSSRDDYDVNDDDDPHSDGPPAMPPRPESTVALEALLERSALVAPEDRNLVLPHVYLALSQMIPCRMFEQDRIGPYKNRRLGIPGMRCGNCSHSTQQPTPGKAAFTFGHKYRSGKFYYPNSARSLGQTTTIRSIVRHVARECGGCPTVVRDAVVASLVGEAAASNHRAGDNGDTDENGTVEEGSANATPPSDNDTASRTTKCRYGARKTFFDRVWNRIASRALSLPSPSSTTSSSFTGSDDDPAEATQRSHGGGGDGTPKSNPGGCCNDASDGEEVSSTVSVWKESSAGGQRPRSRRRVVIVCGGRRVTRSTSSSSDGCDGNDDDDADDDVNGTQKKKRGEDGEGGGQPLSSSLLLLPPRAKRLKNHVAARSA